MAAESRRSGRFHRCRVSAQQRIHLAALLIFALAVPAVAEDISFDPTITQEQFHTFSALVGQAIFPTPVSPGESGDLLGFEVGLAGTAIPIDEDAEYWTRSVKSDLAQDGYLAVPRFIVSKGIGIGNLSASYAQVPDSDVKMIGGALDLPLIRGGLVKPTLVLRATYGQLQGVDQFEVTTYGGEAVLGKAFGPLTPYIGAGVAHVESKGRTAEQSLAMPIFVELRDEFEQDRYTAGLRLSLFLIRLVAEVTRSEETTYSVKVSLGL